MDAAVRAERDCQTESLLGLRRAHRHRDHLAAVLVPQPGRVRDGVGVERVQQQRHALTLERLRLLVALDRVGPWNLLDEADDLHGDETIRPCSACSTTSTATCRRSTLCSPTPRSWASTAGCSAATTGPRALGGARRSPGCGTWKTRRGSPATASAGSASRRSTG